MKKIFYVLCVMVVAPMLLLSQNQGPVAVNDTVMAVFGEEMTVNFLANDYDPEGDSIWLSEIVYDYCY